MENVASKRNIKDILNKIKDGLKWAYGGKYKWAFILPSLLVLIYLLYFAVVFRYNSQTYANNYDGYTDYDIIKYVSTTIGILVLAIVVAKCIFDLVKQKFNAKKAIIAILVLGITIRIVYMLYTPIYYNYGTWKQHDIIYGGNTGHYYITMYIYRNMQIPDMIRNADGVVDFAKSGQLYQPKFAHVIYALFMKFNSLFVHFGDELAEFIKRDGTIYTMDNMTKNEYALYEMNRIITSFFSCYLLITMYRIINEFKLSDKAKAIGTLLFAFTPVFYMFSTSMNNDLLSYFFGFLAILYAIRWYKRGGYLNIILIAIFLGCGMSCKLSIGFLAFFIAALFIYKLVRIFINKNKEKTSDEYLPSLLVFFLQMFIFAIIVFPIGLSYPLYAKFRFDQPINYVWLISKYNWNYIDDSVSKIYRFMIYPAPDFFKEIFVRNTAWIGGKGGYVDPDIQANLWNYVLKSSIFGEYSWNKSLSVPLYFTSFILMFSVIGYMIYLVVKVIKDKKIDILNLFTITILGLSYLILAINFNITYPFTCSMDYRYFVPFTLVVALSLALAYDKLSTKDNKINNVFRNIIPILLILFSSFSYLLYLL